MSKENPPPKIAFIFDDRLPHDRKIVFARMINILKVKLNFEILPTQMTEAEVLAHLNNTDYSLVLLPWYKYTSWKKIEHHFGAMRMQGVTVAGYFADAILPFEFSKMPNYNRFILLDFYRLDQNDIEALLGALVQLEKKPGFQNLIPPGSPVYTNDWYDHDHRSTRCLDTVLSLSLFDATHWQNRLHSIRFYLTALWSLCFEERHSFQNKLPCGLLEISEFNQRLAIKLTFENTDLTLKQMMSFLWPNHDGEKNLAIRELVRHSDFVRAYHFPESHHIELTGFFTPQAPALHHTGELRGFWIEPLRTKLLKSTDEEIQFKKIPILRSNKGTMPERLQEVLETLRALQSQLANSGYEERAIIENQVSNLRFLVDEIEKKVAEKKKVA